MRLQLAKYRLSLQLGCKYIPETTDKHLSTKIQTQKLTVDQNRYATGRFRVGVGSLALIRPRIGLGRLLDRQSVVFCKQNTLCNLTLFLRQLPAT
jgi:hypothetical protein